MLTETPSEDPIDLALAFVNTLRRDTDDLSSPHALGSWLAVAPSAPSADGAPSRRPTSPPALRALHDEALVLREEVRALLAAHASRADPAPHTLHALNRVLESGRRGARLFVSGTRALELRPVEHATSPLSVLYPFAAAAARLVTTVAPGRLRTCDAPDCPEWFVDTSKGGRRRWCSMARCGNRLKAVRHRRRAAGTP